jgi:hypothetical protein
VNDPERDQPLANVPVTVSVDETGRFRMEQHYVRQVQSYEALLIAWGHGVGFDVHRLEGDFSGDYEFVLKPRIPIEGIALCAYNDETRFRL